MSFFISSLHRSLSDLALPAADLHAGLVGGPARLPLARPEAVSLGRVHEVDPRLKRGFERLTRLDVLLLVQWPIESPL